MKKMLLLATIALLAASLTACAVKGQEVQTKVKCPACGTQFEIPPHGR